MLGQFQSSRLLGSARNIRAVFCHARQSLPPEACLFSFFFEVPPPRVLGSSSPSSPLWHPCEGLPCYAGLRLPKGLRRRISSPIGCWLVISQSLMLLTLSCHPMCRIVCNYILTVVDLHQLRYVVCQDSDTYRRTDLTLLLNSVCLYTESTRAADLFEARAL